jgi:cytochrome c-type biogenesis protein CcmH/NrfG
MLDAGQAAPIEDYENATLALDESLGYYVERTPTAIVHHERRVDESGEVIYDQGIPVAFTVGSGERGRSYLVNREGRLYASPISWYTGPKKWGLSPGYTADHNLRFGRKVSEGCLSCHAGRVALHGEDRDRFADPPLLEASIGCERCHGPGQQHIAYRSGTVSGADHDSIVNPQKLTGARRDAVCNQCHLQGRRRVVRLGRSEFDFRPGKFLSDNWVIFLKTAGVESGTATAVSQVEQMYASKCYLQSGRTLGCISCHSGHRVARGDEALLAYREKCLNCHSGKKPGCSEDLEKRQSVTAADSCIVCHMPGFPAADVHATQTDHRILRQPASQQPETAPEPRFRDAKSVLFEEPGATVVEKEWNRARGIILAEQAAAGGGSDKAQAAASLLQPLVHKAIGHKATERKSAGNRPPESRSPGDVEGLYLLGRAYEKLNQPHKAVKAWKEVLELRPRHEAALDALAVHYHETQDLGAAREYYERLIEINPEKSEYFGRLAHVLGQQGDLERGIEIAEKCLELNPSLMQTHAWLVEACRSAGDTKRAAFHEAKVRQFESLQKHINPKR